MALFEVPGWSVPTAPVSILAQSTSKKRKRPAAQDADKMQSAEVNLDKLMQKLGSVGNREDKQGPKKKKKKQERTTRAPDTKGAHATSNKATEKVSSPHGGSIEQPVKGVSGLRKKVKQKKSLKHDAGKPEQRPRNVSPAVDEVPGLTSLQKGMKESLDGARFRWINELLYKSDSSEAVRMMKEDPAVFHDYHSGFRHQVQSWPSNPVSHYISQLSSYPQNTIIADLGCGDAVLARGLSTKKLKVLSFDLISDGGYIVAADICSSVPLPGSEPSSSQTSEGEAQVVDVVVCALSLMGTNWPRCIREAWRILKPGGELKIAEVASRFTDVDEFVSLIDSIGFKMKAKDDRNSHFTLFEFKKVARTSRTDKEWSKVMSKGDILKPCEYKRR
ncbi:methyltransferase-domain-containing protein [Suillus paluster]|uniref:methyltransferase-domain-containing protein n=1 Tax=Suillus paluster TaxID=48578 RepID=UPI001B884B06|nr:methyltransferase-domain-containing protein [Suillus paluster]KAG1753879.1 methyltransferase-domain-containing protein [Suillus paluster]